MQNRLSKVLAAAGVASRRACESLIFQGRVQVNGRLVLTPQTIVTLGRDLLTVDGHLVKAAESKRYYMLHKPAGVICSNAPGYAKRVIDLFDDPERLFTVGRLDYETSGLLLVTNDGQFADAISHPSHGMEKEYLVKTQQEITDAHLKALSVGTAATGGWVCPVRVTKVRNGTLKIVLQEGRKHAVRTLVAAAGLTLLSLVRIRIGGLLLGTLPVGAYRELSESERDQIFQG